jgi:signal transduction histidine kinase/ActR/RegA family two-component response regulator
VKLPNTHDAASNQGSAFLHDALHLARLAHVALPRVHHVDATDKTAFAILDAVEGRPLLELLETQLSEIDALEIALQLTDCLSQLHAAGFVHGDVSCQRVYVTDGAFGVRLSDFGTVCRPIPFDPGADLIGLELLLKQLAWQGVRAAKASNGLASIAEAWTSSAPLAQLRLQLLARRDALAHLDTLPPPSIASAGLQLTAASLRARVHGSARAELTQLRRYWEQAADDDGKVIVVMGQAGSGKSRILQTFAEHLTLHGVPVLSMRCSDSAWAPFSAIKSLLDNHLAQLALLTPAEADAITSALRTAAGPMASHLRVLSPSLAKLFRDAETVFRDGDAQEVFIDGLSTFLSKYLELMGRSALVIDDVHWLDASSRMVLSRVAGRVCALGHVVVCSVRDDEDGREALERFDAMLASGISETVRLGGLALGDARKVVAEFLGTARDAGVIQDGLVEQIAQLSDGTPLSLLELLGLTLEHRVLRLRFGVWQLDGEALQQMQLPAPSQALITRRLESLDQATAIALRAAAVIRSRIAPQLLAAVTHSDETAMRSALDRAAGARLLVRTVEGHYAFVHDCVWEALLAEVPLAEQRSLHQAVADVLAARVVADSEEAYQLARHYAAGIIETAPERAYAALRNAGERAIQACDDTLALSLLKPAERAAHCAGIEPGRLFYAALAETSLRAGATQESLAYFERALERSSRGFEAAYVLGRMAWIHHYESNTTACWAALEAALLEVGRSLPANTSLALARAGLSRLLRPHLSHDRSLTQVDRETLCELYVLCMRVALENAAPARALSAILRLSAAATELRPCRVLVMSELMTAFGLALLSTRTPWRQHLERAHAIARELADPVAITSYHQGHYVLAAWFGDLDESERQAYVCLAERAQFMELGEVCYLSFGVFATEICLGRPEHALVWAERAIARVQQSVRAPAVFGLLEDGVCATLSVLKREHEIPELKRRVARVERADIQPGSYLDVLSFQSRMLRATQDDELGEEFEALVQQWEALGHDSKKAHLVVAVFFVHVAHARVHQCLRARPNTRRRLIRKLHRALLDLEASARMPVVAAHAHVTRAAYHWFRGERESADTWLGTAETLARETSCVWVSYAAARLRAHMLKARGKLGAAREQARSAAHIARTFGPPSRLRFITQEFDLGDPLVEKRPDPDAPSLRRHLDALLHIAQASSRDLGPQRQARFIVDELLQTLAAGRGYLFMRDGAGKLQCHAARSAAGEDLAPIAHQERRLVEQVYATGQTQLAGPSAPPGLAAISCERECIVVALVLREQVVGVLYLDRAAADGGFGNDDVSLLEALANQVPVALELADALREREHLERNLRQAQKMEAIGRLAGGIAHDFNNILATIEFAAGCLNTRVTSEGQEDLSEIRNAARRGAELTRQLLMFSRGKSVPPRRMELGEVVQRLHPMLSRLVRSDVHVDLTVAEQALPAMADPSQIERLLMNLCRNASDAMPHGGTITVCLGRATTTPDQVLSADVKTGYAELSVADTGTGMTEEVRARLFEPFFTTKSSQQGTGLGLAIVYAIVQQYGGHVEVASELGLGTTFRVYLPLNPEEARAPHAAHNGSRSTQPGAYAPTQPLRKTIIVVDDDDILRRQTARTLESAGYDVLTARDGEDALRVIADATNLPDLAVTDVQMPTMDGPQLAARLRSSDPNIKLLFMSGDGANSLQHTGFLDAGGTFLAKPFKPEVLLSEIAVLLGMRDDSSADDVGGKLSATRDDHSLDRN